ncbi:MAG: cysteine desulfurase [Chloroflexota bacterium]|nr:MAG: cysteine desulfurase [SAR202 cluster bacterium]MED5409216.1 cysteine desulfurase [Chloroflexota bacterium]MED5450265.1 cysteine desulfurase [Chloroflexota bacterium]|tara:strand:- start:4503 stop:5744 length:1242 start_codon:yes stop_codon:yes gene_type:complete
MFDVEKIRLDFPILAKEIFGNPLVYLDNAATSQKPRQVIDALVDYYENFNANVHRGVHTLSMEATDKYEDAREKVSSFINSESSDSVIWTRNASESLNLVAYSWGENNINEGDEILLTPMEHHSNLVPWQELARRKNADIKFIPMLENGTLDMDRVDDLITEKTALVSAVHMSNALGTINPVRELGVKAHRMGAKILVDGAQSVPHMPTDVQELNCDFLVFSGHKMLGPTGIGALYVKKEILESMEPFLTGGEMVLEVSYEEASWADLPMKFEAGTPNIADSIGLGSAVDYLNVLGMENVREHEKDLTTYALNRFKNADLEGLDLFGPDDPNIRGGVFSFNTPDVHPHDLGTFLDRIGIAVRTGHHCAMPLVRSLGVAATARASFYLYNTKKEVDILVDGVTEALRYFRDGPN